MNGVRFFLDHKDEKAKRKGQHQGNVTAILVANGIFYSDNRACYEAIGAVFFRPNSPCEGTAASLEWMRTCGKRISEKEAREIHPELFWYLDDNPEENIA
jgi:hypothetical protein